MTRESASAAVPGLLADLTALGPYFAVDVHRPGAPPRPPWQPLEALVTGPGDEPPLFGGLRPYPENWRARISPITSLPHYPMVLHRGGYPDGS